MIITRKHKRELKSTRNWTDVMVAFQRVSKEAATLAREMNRVLRRTAAKIDAIVGRPGTNRRIRKARRRNDVSAYGWYRHQRLVRLGL